MHRSLLRRTPLRGRATLLTLAAAALLAPGAAHATPAGSNGDLLGQVRESNDYMVLDPTKGVDDNLDARVFLDGRRMASVRSSPDGQHIAYINLEDNRVAIAAAADGAGERLLPGTAEAREVAVSPDGATIAFTRNDHVWTVPADGSAAPTQIGPTLVQAYAIDWAPDGSEIVVTADGAGGHSDLYAMKPAGDDAHPITQTSAIDELDVSFAPDASRLAVGAHPLAGGTDD